MNNKTKYKTTRICKYQFFLSALCSLLFSFLLLGCGSNPNTGGTDELDLAIRDASDYLNDNIPKDSKIVILNVQSDSSALSDYIIDELIANAVNDKVFTVVDRQQIDSIRAEQDFQLSGDVDDNTAIAIGKFFGAQFIVSCRVSQIADRYRMNTRALNVQTAQVQGQYNRNIAAGRTINALMNSKGGSGGSGSIATATASARQTSRTTGSATSRQTAPSRIFATELQGTWTWVSHGIGRYNEVSAPNPSNGQLVINDDTITFTGEWTPRGGYSIGWGQNNQPPMQGVAIKGYSLHSGMKEESAQGIIYIMFGGSFQPYFEYIIRTRTRDGAKILTTLGGTGWGDGRNNNNYVFDQ